MKILVTGGAGFIGSNFIRYWLKNYPRAKIVNLDKLTYAGHLSSTKDFADNSRYQFVKSDIGNARLVGQVMKGIDFVINFAAESHVDRSLLKPDRFLKTNILGTQTLLKAALANRVKRFHHVSTDEVFGSLSLSSRDKFDEETAYNPQNPYAASKAAADHLVRTYFRSFNLPVTITNCSNNFGPYQDPEKFIPRQITNFLSKKKATIYGDGRYVRDWLYVQDHVLAIEAVLLKGRSGSTYCLGGQKNREYNNLTIVEMILKNLGLEPLAWVQFVRDRRNHDRRYAVSWQKIRQELGWKPRHEFEFYLKETVNWYRENGWWWRPLKSRAESIYGQ